MKLLIASLFLILATASAAIEVVSPLAKEAETLQVSVRIAQMWAAEKAFQDGLDQLEKKGHDHEDLLKTPELGEKWQKLVRDDHEEMKRIFTKWGWPSLSVFGSEANKQAYWLAMHADQDIGFQEKCLLLAAKALETKDTGLVNFAALWDRVHVNKHQLQRYGTQGDCRGKGLWEPAPMEEPPHLNIRRRLMGMAPMENYLSEKNATCYSMNQ